MKPVFAIVILSLSMASCDFSLTGDCANTIKSEAQSPDGRYVATVYVRDCGATTDSSSIISLRPRSSRFNDEEGRVFVNKGEQPITLKWNNRVNLSIKCLGCSAETIFKHDKTWNDISISY